jgi:streptogramin lyase
VKANERVYPMQQASVGLMQPAVDAQGNLWIGEMGTNRLARLDPHTGAVTTWQPPDGRYNIMATAVDAQGHIWFTEQVANYIGRFDPATQQFTTFPLEQVNGHTSSPQDLAFDARGNLWFTEITGAKIGRLNPLTGAISTWPIPPARSGVSSYPFSLAITPSGQVWFGQLDGGAVGRLDPVTGIVRQFLLADPHAQVYAMAADARGHVWFTELVQGALGLVETATGKVTEITVPETFGGNVNLYGIVSARDGSVWFACTASNAIVRYVPGAGTFTFYQLATKNAVPFGLTQDALGTLWFTGTGSVRDYVGALLP